MHFCSVLFVTNSFAVNHYKNIWIFLLEWGSFPGSSQLTHWPPGKFEWNFRHVIFKQILVIDGWGISCEIALIWMSLDFTDDQSTLVQVMAWCQATSHYLSQCWPRYLSPYGLTRPQWVKRGFKYHFTSPWTWVSTDISRSVSGSL